MSIYTTKQMGDACEMLIAAELTLSGVPALKAPDFWPGYDVIAQPPPPAEPQRISVKSRTFKTGSAFVTYSATDVFDWLAIVILPAGLCDRRRLFVIPRDLADEKARTYKTEKMIHVREYRIDEIFKKFARYENNYKLHQAPTRALLREAHGGTTA